MNQYEKKTFAIVGFGGQGEWHCKQILKSDVASLIGVYDILNERMEKAIRDGINVYSSFEEILRDSKVETVVIAVPNHKHKELSIKALLAGKNVICEKPVEMTVKALDEIISASKKSGKLFTVHQNRRWDIDYLAMRQIIKSHEIGDVIHIESRVHGSRGIPSDWRSEKQYGGGMLLDWGVHLIDQVLLLFTAKIKQVYCRFEHITNNEVDDGFKLNLYFDDNTSALIEVGTYNFIAMPRFYLQCKEGSAIIKSWEQNVIVRKMIAWNEKEVTPIYTASGITKTMAPRDEITIKEYRNDKPHSDVHDFYRNFCKAIDGKENLLINISEVRRVLQVIEAAFLSDQEQQVVKVEI